MMHRDGNQCYIICLIVLAFLCSVVASSNTYTWEKSYPQSCECMETGVSGKNCDLFRCTCTCDVTAQVCDYGCCCDPDCSDSQVSGFKSNDECAPEGFAPESETICYSDTQLAKINPKEPLYGNPTAKRALDQALCVSKKNFAPKSDYYTDTAVQSKSIFSKRSGQKQFDYSAPISYSIPSPDSNYDKGDAIPAYSVVDPTDHSYLPSSTSNSKEYVPFSENVWRLPTTDFSGECNSFGNVRFEEAFETKNCRRAIPYSEFSDTCSNELSLQYLVHSLVLAEKADLSVTLFGSPSSSNTIKTVLRSVKYANGENFDSFEVLSNPPIQPLNVTKWDGSLRNGSCATYAWKGAQNEAGAGWDMHDLKLCTPFLQELSTFNTTAANKGRVACLGAVKEVAYTVIHAATKSGDISFVYADVILTDIYPSDSSSDVVITQSFSVDFESASDKKISNSNGNMESRPRSGNPGYLEGKPVVLGSWDGSASSQVSFDSQGIQLPAGQRASPSSHSSTECARSDTMDIVQWETRTLNYGEDISSGCSMSLNWDTLRDLCCEQSTKCSPTNPSVYSDRKGGLPLHFTNVTLASFMAAQSFAAVNDFQWEAYIGQYGNADPLDPNQWIKMALSSDTSILTSGKSWDPLKGVCSNMPSALHFKFLVVKSGERFNPQMKIVSADIEMATSDWKMRVPAGDRSTTQNFHLTTTVSFVLKNDQSYKGYVPPNPPALFSVPEDIFYPFASRSNSAVSFKSVNFATLAIAVALSTIALICQSI